MKNTRPVASPRFVSQLVRILIILSAAALNRTSDSSSELTFSEADRVDMRVDARVPGIDDAALPRQRGRYSRRPRVQDEERVATNDAGSSRVMSTGRDFLWTHTAYGAGNAGLSALGRCAL